jgi:N-acetylglutamate synthase-like GNAT family acetyltransferase
MNSQLSKVRIAPAREGSLAAINALVARSKAHWSWPEGYLERSLPLHTLAPTYLRHNYCFEVLGADGELLAFFAVVASDERVVLDNLWVEPELIGRGIGRSACEYIVRLAREHGWRKLWVLPDPPAEGFYRKTGFVDTGERVPSRIPEGPVFSVYCMTVSAEQE